MQGYTNTDFRKQHELIIDLELIFNIVHCPFSKVYFPNIYVFTKYTYS